MVTNIIINQYMGQSTIIMTITIKQYMPAKP